MLFFLAIQTMLNFSLVKQAKSAEDLIAEYGGIKPCIHGSDAHDLNKLFEPDLQRYCWIKAEPTF